MTFASRIRLTVVCAVTQSIENCISLLSQRTGPADVDPAGGLVEFRHHRLHWHVGADQRREDFYNRIAGLDMGISQHVLCGVDRTARDMAFASQAFSTSCMVKLRVQTAISSSSSIWCSPRASCVA